MSLTKVWSGEPSGGRGQDGAVQAVAGSAQESSSGGAVQPLPGEIIGLSLISRLFVQEMFKCLNKHLPISTSS